MPAAIQSEFDKKREVKKNSPNEFKLNSLEWIEGIAFIDGEGYITVPKPAPFSCIIQQRDSSTYFAWAERVNCPMCHSLRSLL